MKRNLARAAAAMRRWRTAHPDAKKLRSREYYAAHRAEIIGKAAEYARSHPDIVRMIRNNRRCREVGADGSLTSAAWLALVEEYEGRCAYCDMPARLVPDHGTPLARGGSNRVENIFPACPRCNNEKYTMTVDEYRGRRRAEGRHVRPLLER
ncbi:MAG: HNH endonuclease [Chloroflexota bacterium]|nr:HNH endonuclease [Chloroflexota bacterium]